MVAAGVAESDVALIALETVVLHIESTVSAGLPEAIRAKIHVTVRRVSAIVVADLTFDLLSHFIVKSVKI